MMEQGQSIKQEGRHCHGKNMSHAMLMWEGGGNEDRRKSWKEHESCWCGREGMRTEENCQLKLLFLLLRIRLFGLFGLYIFGICKQSKLDSGGSCDSCYFGTRWFGAFYSFAALCIFEIFKQSKLDCGGRYNSCHFGGGPLLSGWTQLCNVNWNSDSNHLLYYSLQSKARQGPYCLEWNNLL